MSAWLGVPPLLPSQEGDMPRVFSGDALRPAGANPPAQRPLQMAVKAGRAAAACLLEDGSVVGIVPPAREPVKT